MTKEQAKEYFEGNYNSLYAGSNYLIDKEDNVFWCECWASGGIWFINEFNSNHKDYYHHRKAALTRKDTVFEKR